MKDRKSQMILMVGAAIVCLMTGLASAAHAADVSLGVGVGLAGRQPSEKGQHLPLLNPR